MSGIAGVFMRSGAPADLHFVEAMAATTPHRAPDGAWKISDGCFAGIRQHSITTPEDRFESGPVCDPASKFVILFDGRLDNRDEVLHDLCDLQSDRAVCDARIVLAAWNEWGTDTPARLLGDFAFVVWDPCERTVSCVRDPMGVRPFFYHLADDLFVFGSEVRQVLAHPRVRRAPDEMMIADLLTFGDRRSDRTLYRDICRLPHARTLVVRTGRSEITRYWHLDSSRELTLHDDGEYADGFREAFDQAVAARLRSIRPIGVHLSGGLDSSSVVVTARAICEAPIVPFSLVFPGHAACDERRYIDAVLEHAAVTGVQVIPRPLDGAGVTAQIQGRRYLPDYPNDAADSAVGRAMSSRGMRLTLTGFGGDEGLAGSYFHCADLLARGHVLRFARRYRDAVRQPGMPWYSADVLRASFWPALPLSTRLALRPFARRAFARGAPEWLSPAFIEQTGLSDPSPATDLPAGRAARYHVIQAYEHSWKHATFDACESASAELRIERRHPFYDRRLIEFMVALPDDQRWQHGTTKYVLRRAMKGRLPETIRTRTDASKADFSHLFVDALEMIGGEPFFSDGMELASAGWIIPRAVRALHQRMRALQDRGDAAYADVAWSLWGIAAVELWFRGVLHDGRNWSTSWAAQKTSVRPNDASKMTRALEGATGSPS